MPLLRRENLFRADFRSGLASTACDQLDRFDLIDSHQACVDAPVDASNFFGRIGKFGQVLSCVRPLDAARHTPRALMEMRGSGPNRLRELESSPFGCWFSRPRLVDRFALARPPSCPHPRRLPALRHPLRRLRAREPGRSLSSSSAPRRCAPSGWPAPQRPASGVCAPASWRATDRLSCRAGSPSGQPPWRP